MDPKPYVIHQGDTLASIARQFAFSNWKEIYYHPANSAFRARRPDPNRLQAGELIMVPPSPQMVHQVLQQRLNSLMRLRLDNDILDQHIESDMDANLRQYVTTAGMADAAAEAGTLLVSLGSLAYKGMAAMKLSGTVLETANKELGKQALELAYDPLQDPALRFAGKINAHAGIVWAIEKASIQAFLDIQSLPGGRASWPTVRTGKADRRPSPRIPRIHSAPRRTVSRNSGTTPCRK